MKNRRFFILVLCAVLCFVSAMPAAAAENPYKGRTAAFYGDSITEKNWHYSKGYYQWMQELLGFSEIHNRGKTDLTSAQIFARFKGFNNNEDYIFICAGTNDQTFSVPIGSPTDMTDKTVYGVYNLWTDYLIKNHPEQTVIFITPHFQTRFMGDNTTMTGDVAEVIKEVCGKKGFSVYDNYSLSGINASTVGSMTTDRCHWNDGTHEKVGRAISAWMLEKTALGDVDNDSLITAADARLILRIQ